MPTQVHSLLYHPYDQRMFSAADDSEILVWEPLPPRPITAGSDGRLVMAGRDGVGGGDGTVPVVRQELDVDAWSSDDALGGGGDGDT